MAWRKWLVRCLVFSVLGTLASIGGAYYHLTNPESIRRQVVSQLESQLRGVHVRVETARLRLLGGVSVGELRIVRADDPGLTDLLYVPSAIIYHDKEQLLKGTLAIRKVQLQRPRLRVVRERDGRWNVAGLLGPTHPEEAMPTIVIEQGTFLFEDRRGAADLMPVEIKNVNLTLVNDPLPVLAIEMRGACDLTGTLHVRASWQRVGEALSATLETGGAAIGPALVQRLASYAPEAANHVRQLSGVVQGSATLDYQCASAGPLAYHVLAHLTEGALDHPQCPLPLRGLEAHARIDDGRVTLDSLAARAGDTRLSLKGSLEALNADADLTGEVKIERVVLNPELFAKLPETLHDIETDYSPRGLVDIALDFGRKQGVWRRHSVIRADDAAARIVHFPYAIEHVKGVIEQEVDPAQKKNVRRIDLEGRAGSRPIHVKGEASGFEPAIGIDVHVWGEDLPLDDKLREALPPKYRRLASSFRPKGLGDFHARIHRVPGAARFANEIQVRFHDASILYDVFPYPLERVSGVLDIKPDHFEFRDFRLSHKGGEFLVHGRSHPTPTGDRISTEIRGVDILLDDELKEALAPRGHSDSKLKAAWATLHPGGRLNVTAVIDQLPEQPEDVDVTVTARGCTLKPDFFPYPMEQVSGTVRYARDRLDLTGLTAKQGQTILTLDEGQIFLKRIGGFYARLGNLKGNPLVPDAAFHAALPRVLAKGFEALHLKNPVGLTARELIIDMPAEPNMPPVIYWDGGVSLQDATLQVGVELEKVKGQFWCRGRHNGRQLEGVLGNLLLERATLFKQPIQDVHCRVEVKKDAPDVISLPGLTARFFGGDVGGEARVEFGPTLHYELNLTALQVKLEEFGRHNLGPNVQLEGQATARLHLTGQGTEVEGMEGRGSLDVPNGKLYKLPVLLDLLKVLALWVPDRTAFEEMHSTFTIKGPRVAVSRLDLYGNAISLTGQGEMNLDGSDLQLDFYAVWGRIMQMLPPLFRPIPPAIAGQFLKIKVRGKVDDVRCTNEPVPFLVEPLERLLKSGDHREAANGKKPGAEQLPRAGGKIPATLTGRSEQ